MSSIALRVTHPPRSLDQRLAQILSWAAALGFVLFVAWPLAAILMKSVQDRDGAYIGLRNLLELAAEPRLRDATWNSIRLSLETTLLVVPTALLFAFTLTRSRLPGRSLLRLIGLSPLLAPSLMPGISLVYLFGNQGLLKSWLGDSSIYGSLGIVIGEAFYTFPHALLILATALSVADARLYEAAEVLGAGRLRRFMTVTLPGIRYGLVSSAMVVFTLVVTDFGVPKVIGGQTNVLALEAYKQVIGQQHFGKGAVIGLLLLLPAVLSFLVERRLARGKGSALSGRSVAYQPVRNLWRDGSLGIACFAIVVSLAALLLVAVAAAFMQLWPYNLHFSWSHFDFDNVDGGGWSAFYHSIEMAAAVAVAGTAALFASAYLVQKTPIPAAVSATVRSLALLPMAVPGMVLGLGYIFCFNAPSNPLHGLYGTMAILVVATIAHYSTTPYLTLVTALRQIDGEIEAVGQSLGRAWWTSLWRVTLPICLPALLDVTRFLFVSAMTTVSCVIFLYTPDTVLASVAVLNMDDAGDTAAAAAMASLIIATSFVATLALNLVGWLLNRRTQAWRIRH
jgi:iron(III) transport system permease protein